MPADQGRWKIDAAEGPGRGPERRRLAMVPWVGDTGAQLQSLMYTKDTCVGWAARTCP